MNPKWNSLRRFLFKECRQCFQCYTFCVSICCLCYEVKCTRWESDRWKSTWSIFFEDHLNVFWNPNRFETQDLILPHDHTHRVWRIEATFQSHLLDTTIYQTKYRSQWLAISDAHCLSIFFQSVASILHTLWVGSERYQKIQYHSIIF